MNKEEFERKAHELENRFISALLLEGVKPSEFPQEEFNKFVFIVYSIRDRMWKKANAIAIGTI